MSRSKMTSNVAQCRKCGGVIESLHNHHYVTCECGSLSIDGGLEYRKRVCSDPDGLRHISGRSYAGYKDLSTYVPWDMSNNISV